MSKWISVDDELPPEGQAVIVSAAGWVIPAYRRTTRFHKNPEKVAPWADLSGRVFRVEITHWMPLPEPPK